MSIYNSSELVSVIMPSYNSAETIEASINSVLKQSYSNWELIITDDLSIDNTVNIVREIAKVDHRIKLYTSLENGGAGKARNNCISKANGRFIAFLDADDLWLPKKLEKQITFMLEKNYYFTYTAYQKFSSKGIAGVISPVQEINYNKLLFSNEIGCLTVIYDTSEIGKKYMPLIRKRQDMGLWLEILKSVNKAYCLDEVLAMYRTDSGMTQNKLKVLSYQWEFYRKIVGLSFFRSSITFFVYACKGYMKSRK